MKRKVTVGIITIAVFAIGAVALSVSQTMNASSLRKMTPEERVAGAERWLQEMMAHVDGESIALVSFDSIKDKNIAGELSKNHNVKVKQLYHVFKTPTNTFRGGYLAIDDKNIEEALSRYESEIRAGLEGTIADVKVQIERDIIDAALPNTPEQQKEFEMSIQGSRILLADAESFLTDLKKHGLKIYGLQVSGKNKDLLKLSKEMNVKLVEMIDIRKDIKASPILPPL